MPASALYVERDCAAAHSRRAGGQPGDNGVRLLPALTVRHAVPAIYENRIFAAAGGLMSYGAAIFENYRLAGVYTGRALKGENPAELPVLQRWVYDDGGVP